MMIKKIFPLILALMTINGFAQKTAKQTAVLLSTSYGEIKLVLYNETPKHRDNFIKLVKEEFFNGTLFHRVINGFMIQGGDPDSKNAKPGQTLGIGGPGYTVPAEFNTKFIHKKGALSAARMDDNVNPKKESSGSQFYIVQGKKSTKAELEGIGKRNGITYTAEQIKTYETLGGTAFLDMNYTVFGEVIEGLEVIDKIATVKKGRGDRPVEDIKMTMKIVKK
jgi:peptidyl-prolyl cis-trans isomerase B (cyclophilin B)